MIASAGRFALLAEMPPDNTEPNVGDLLARMAPVDIILLDGFRRSRYPKMEVVPAEQDRPRLAPGDKTVLAITSDAPIAANVAWLSLKDISALADFALATSRVVAG